MLSKFAGSTKSSGKSSNGKAPPIVEIEVSVPDDKGNSKSYKINGKSQKLNLSIKKKR